MQDMGWDSYWGYYKPAKQKEVKDGITAKSKRGAIGETWWSKRWIAVLESFNMGARLTRGRSYARKGQVVSIDVQNGIVTAKVQGTRSKKELATKCSCPNWANPCKHIFPPRFITSLQSGSMKIRFSFSNSVDERSRRLSMHYAINVLQVPQHCKRQQANRKKVQKLRTQLNKKTWNY